MYYRFARVHNRQYEEPPRQPDRADAVVVLNQGDFQLPLQIGFPEEISSAQV